MYNMQSTKNSKTNLCTILFSFIKNYKNWILNFTQNLKSTEKYHNLFEIIISEAELKII